MRLPLLARIDRYTEKAVVLLPDGHDGTVNVPMAMTAVTLIGVEYHGYVSGPYELTDMTEQQRIDAACLLTVIAWLPGWKLRELGLKSMMPEDKAK